MENIEDKESFLEQRIKARNASNESLAEKMLKDLGQESIEPQEPDVGDADAPASIPECCVCNGKRFVQGLFSRSECFACDGTGYDLSDPIKVIKHQQQLLKWAKGAILTARKERDEALDTRTDEEKKADAVEAFYKDSKYGKHD